ncbi:MAG TPA: trehalose-phosphatase, partial [Candidatus Paceibacterota bacterium]
IRERGGITVTHGKMLIEVRPDVPWHKGAFIRMAIDRLSRGKNVLSIFIGDDETDEDAFRTLPEAITVRVGDIQESAARYSIEPRDRVDEFLEWLLGEISEGVRT